MEDGCMFNKWTKYKLLVKLYVKYQYLKFYIVNSSIVKKWFKGVNNG